MRKYLIGCALMGLAVAAHAEPSEGASSRTAPPRAHSASCEAMRLAGWFDHQRMLTDGSADPTSTWASSACGERMRADAAQDDGSAREEGFVAKSTHHEAARGRNG